MFGKKRPMALGEQARQTGRLVKEAKKNGSPKFAGIPSTPTAMGGKFKMCRKCGGAGRMNKTNYRGKCLSCNGNGYV